MVISKLKATEKTKKKPEKNHNFLFKIAQNSEQDGDSTGLGLPLWLRLNYYTPKMGGA